jgi:hypothetical protein
MPLLVDFEMPWYPDTIFMIVKSVNVTDSEQIPSIRAREM